MYIYKVAYEVLEEGFHQFDFEWVKQDEIYYSCLSSAVFAVLAEAKEIDSSLTIQEITRHQEYKLGDIYRWIIRRIEVIQ